MFLIYFRCAQETKSFELHVTELVNDNSACDCDELLILWTCLGVLFIG